MAAGYYLQHHSRELALSAPIRRNIPLAAVSDIGGRGRFCESKAMLAWIARCSPFEIRNPRLQAVFNIRQAYKWLRILVDLVDLVRSY